MASEQAYLRRIDRLFQHGSITGLDEGQLLERFVARRDDSALEALVERHGPMVLGVCWRWLSNTHDAEDAFQATFLILICDLEGQTQHDAARQLGWSEGALRGRLARARGKLRDRLVRRGVAPSFLTTAAPLLPDGLATSVPAALVETTTRAATATLLAGRAAPSAATAISASVAALVQGVIRTMALTKMTSLASAIILAAAGLLIGGGLVQAGLSAVADNPTQSVAAEAESPQPQVTAIHEKTDVLTIDFRVVRRSDKQPIPGVTVAFSYPVDRSPHETKHTTDDRGQCKIELPRAASYVMVSCGKDGFVPTLQRWSEQEIRQGLPATYTTELEAGLPIGGFVHDEEGKPVEGAEVTVAIRQGKRDEPDVDVPTPGHGSIHTYAALPNLTVKTDTRGRWRCSILPTNADQGSRLLFLVRHHDYVSDTGGYARRLSLKTARAMTGAVVILGGSRAFYMSDRSPERIKRSGCNWTGRRTRKTTSFSFSTTRPKPTSKAAS